MHINGGVPKTMEKKSSSGMSALGVLQIIFIVLKCVGVIDWSWWTVFTPFWINLALIAIAVVYLLICEWLDK
jgi:membrane protein YdbS with pleckstrin-like domain